MATKIKDTPVLRGEDAKRFEMNMRKAEKNKVSDEEYQRIMTAYKRVKIVDSRDDLLTVQTAPLA